MAVKTTGAVKAAPFKPGDLTIEQQKLVVEEYLGYNPDYFIYEGQAIKMNLSLFEQENRVKAEKTGEPRVWFNGWKPNRKKYTG